MCLWVAHADNRDACLSLGRSIQERLALRGTKLALTFEQHKAQSGAQPIRYDLSPDN